MRAKIVRIGNSQGVRLPKLLLEQAGLTDEVELTAEAGQIVIAAPRVARTGWAEAAKRLQATEGDRLEPTSATVFDETEWEWR
jgi:antitoxin MazE